MSSNRRSSRPTAVAAALMGMPSISAHAGASDFATIVHEYRPAPGQFVNHDAFNDPARALGPPRGGGVSGADNTSVVSLGGFGGSIMLGFDRTVRDDPRNPMGLDAIVFGNAFWVGQDPTRRWAEAAVIEIARDVNGNGVPDDPWYVIGGSHLDEPQSALSTITWDDDVADATYPPENASWVPPDRTGVWTTTTYRLPADPFEAGFVLTSSDTTIQTVWGYADVSPTARLGDLNADDAVDDPSVTPERFYTIPDDPSIVGITPGSGGGDAFDIAWAIDPTTGGPAGLDGFDFIRISTAAHAVFGALGEVSAEIDAVADVRPDFDADWDGSGGVDVFDLLAYLSEWFDGAADVTGDGATDVFDLLAFLQAWFSA